MTAGGNRIFTGVPFQDSQVIQSLRTGDLVGHCQQPEQLYKVLIVDEQRLLAAQLPVLALRVIASGLWRGPPVAMSLL